MLVKFPHIPPLGWAAPYIGTPWVWQGAFTGGFDCAGWLYHAWTTHWQVTLPDWQADQTNGDDMHRARQGRALIAHFLQDCVEIPHPIPGAGVLMLTGTVPCHVGIYERGGDVIHACETAGELIRERAEDIKPRIVGYYVPAQVIAE